MPRFIFCLPTDRVSGLFNKLFFYSRIGRFWPEFLVISSQELRACVYITPLFRKIKKLTRCSAAFSPRYLTGDLFSEFLNII
ncbi:MAG: hypothetical protein RI928_2643 [Pseudomonadota bacterium]|jgi:hypothetical protein